jgi:hypothetical protein
MAQRYIKMHMSKCIDSPFGQFYLLYKIHKGKKDGRWPTRPVCSDVSSIPHGLGKWVTEQLHPIAIAQKSYFKDSFELKDMLDQLRLRPNARFWKADATSMYTNIETTPALTEISAYLKAEEGVSFHHYRAQTLIDALHIIFQNNYFKFGDTFWRQKSGTGMGISPAPPWATIFFGLYEDTLIPKWKEVIPFYKRFIDDILGVWLCHPCPVRDLELWNEFKSDMQRWHGLEWDCESPSTAVDFMDLSITIAGDRVVTSLYEKPQNLYLYLPEHSSHPPGQGTGLVFGQVLRIRRLCSKTDDADARVRDFQTRLHARGHSPNALHKLFTRAEENAVSYISKTPAERKAAKEAKLNANRRSVRFHLQYHPQDPPSKELQRLWRDQVAHPLHETPLRELENAERVKMGFDKLVVAYSRPLNLRNLFSVRDISDKGRPVSSYLAE